MTRFAHPVVALSVLVGCYSTGTGDTQDDAPEIVSGTDARGGLIDAGAGAPAGETGAPDARASDVRASDAGARDANASDARASDASARDAGAIDAGATDAGTLVEGRCFPDAQLATLRGGREQVQPIGVFGRDGGWVVAYSAFAHSGPEGRFAAFVDRDGRVTATQTLGTEDVYADNAQLGPFVLSWLPGQSALHEIRDDEISARPDLVDRLPPGRIESVVQESDRLRILSATRVDLTAGTFQFAYSELVLDSGGEPALRSGALPAVETLGSPGMVAGLTRYHSLQSVWLHGDTFLFAFPTGEGWASVDAMPWNVLRVALDRSALASGTVGWTLVDETRWEQGPISLFGAFPDLDLAVAGWFSPSDGGGRWPAITVERFVNPEGFGSIPLNAMEDSSTPSLGPAEFTRRGDLFGLHTPGQFRVFSLPSFDLRASVPLELTSTIAHWSDDELIELGSVRTADGLVARVRCHDLALH